MSEYTIYFTTTAVTDVTVEAESYEQAVEDAWDEFQPPVAYHIEDFDLSGDWEVDDAASDPDYGEHRSTERTRVMDYVADTLMLNRGLSAGETAVLLAEKGLLNLPN